MTTDVLPGEPVPPGMEDVVEGVCQIQSTFDEHPGPLIGLEYIVELVKFYQLHTYYWKKKKKMFGALTSECY